MELKPMSKLEQQYSYSHGEAVDAATRCLGHLRGDMGSTGKAFHFTWFDHCGELKTPAFKSEFDDVINALRFDEAYHGILSSRSAMSSYCYKHPECSYGAGVREHGVRLIRKVTPICCGSIPIPANTISIATATRRRRWIGIWPNRRSRPSRKRNMRWSDKEEPWRASCKSSRSSARRKPWNWPLCVGTGSGT